MSLVVVLSVCRGVSWLEGCGCEGAVVWEGELTLVVVLMVVR